MDARPRRATIAEARFLLIPKRVREMALPAKLATRTALQPCFCRSESLSEGCAANHWNQAQRTFSTSAQSKLV